MSERREGRTFEPPPWEREQFDALTRQLSSKQTDVEIDSAISELKETGSPQRQDALVPPKVAEEVPERPLEQGASEAGAKPPASIEEAQVIEMLSQLSAQEPRVSEDLWRLGLLGSLVTGSIGLMMVVIGTVGLARVAKSGPMGVLVASILLMFGVGFCALAVWTAVRTLKQRGVL